MSLNNYFNIIGAYRAREKKKIENIENKGKSLKKELEISPSKAVQGRKSQLKKNTQFKKKNQPTPHEYLLNQNEQYVRSLPYFLMKGREGCF